VIAAVEGGSLDATGWLNHRTTLPAVVDELPRLAGSRNGVVKAVVDVSEGGAG
jgi:hypothetical protein